MAGISFATKRKTHPQRAVQLLPIGCRFWARLNYILGEVGNRVGEPGGELLKTYFWAFWGVVWQHSRPNVNAFPCFFGGF